MAERSRLSSTDEVETIQELMDDLEKRLKRLSQQARAKAVGGSEKAGDFLSEALESLMSRMRETAADASQTLTSEATRVGGNVVKKITDEVEHRPLFMLALAAGAGFLIGVASRR